MAVYMVQRCQTKSGQEVAIRSAVKTDAVGILELSKSVLNEEIYQLTSASEFTKSVEAEEKWIESHLSNPNHIVLVAELNSQIVGLLDFSNGHRTRIAHTGDFGMSVLKEFRDHGIGQLLLKSLASWAENNKSIEKISLNVHANNERAIAVYKKMGYEVEGIRRREIKYSSDLYVDTVVMMRFV
jgi:RimJ/RimL family protein N-acetyltransferase